LLHDAKIFMFDREMTESQFIWKKAFQIKSCTTFHFLEW